MKKLILSAIALLSWESVQAFDSPQPLLTEEMQAAGLTRFAEKAEHDETIYLVEDSVYNGRLIEARGRYENITFPWNSKDGSIITTAIFTTDAFKELWALAQTYDYGPANDKLTLLFGRFDFDTYNFWWSFLRDRPQTEHHMNLYREGLYNTIAFDKEQAEIEEAERKQLLAEGGSTRSSASSTGCTDTSSGSSDKDKLLHKDEQVKKPDAWSIKSTIQWITKGSKQD